MDAYDIVFALAAARVFATLPMETRATMEAKCTALARLLTSGEGLPGNHSAQVGEHTVRCSSDAATRLLTVRAIEPVPPPSSGPRVLIIEDDPDLRWSLADQLESAGFAVETASDGMDALSKLSRGFAADALLLDMVMPVMNGADFLRYRETEPRLQRIPAIVITANPHLVVGLRVQEVLRKPLDLRRLHEVMRSFIPL